MWFLTSAKSLSHSSTGPIGKQKPTFYEQVRVVKSSFAFSGTILLEVPEWPKGLEKSGWCPER
jgi:hypothetical protein